MTTRRRGNYIIDERQLTQLLRLLDDQHIVGTEALHGRRAVLVIVEGGDLPEVPMGYYAPDIEWEPGITVRLEDAQRLFDLAIDTPLLCSGSFETDDVRVLRAFAQTIGVDPALATPEEFTRDFHHAFIPFKADGDRNELSDDASPSGVRWETDEEVYARLGDNPDRCGAGAFRRLCRLPAAAPVHTDPTYGPTEETATP